MRPPEAIEVEADLLPDAMNEVADIVCEKFRHLDYPLNARIEFYGVRMFLTQKYCADSVGRRVTYTFLVTYEERKKQ